ncbi:MAG: hypothetical protein WCI73_02090 [Phycisphaerae bacterium]
MTQDNQEPNIISYAPHPDSEKKLSFGMHWSTIVCYFVAIAGFSCVMGISRPFELSHIATICVLALVILIVCITPAVIGFYFFRRSRRAATLLFLLFLAFWVLIPAGWAGNQYLREKRKAHIAALQVEEKRLYKEMQNKIQNGSLKPVDLTKYNQRIQVSMDAAAKTATDDDAILLRIQAQVFRRETELKERLDDGFAITWAESPLQPHWIKSRADISRARAHIDEVKKRLKELREYYAAVPALISAELRKAHASSAMTSAYPASYAKGLALNRKYFTKIFDLHAQVAQDLQEVCDLLDQNWGEWSVAPASSKVDFQSTTAAESFRALSNHIDSVRAQQTKTRQEWAAACAP